MEYRKLFKLSDKICQQVKHRLLYMYIRKFIVSVKCIVLFRTILKFVRNNCVISFLPVITIVVIVVFTGDDVVSCTVVLVPILNVVLTYGEVAISAVVVS